MLDWTLDQDADSPSFRKTASIDPRTLAEVLLPKRVVDYGIVLIPDDRIKKAYLQLLLECRCTEK